MDPYEQNQSHTKIFYKNYIKKKQHTYPSDQLYKEIGILDIT